MALFIGFYAEMARATTSVEIGQLQIRSTEFVERESVHHYFRSTPEMEETLLAAPGVTAFAPRVLVSGLVGHEEQSRITRIMGVDPGREAQVTVLHEAVVHGRWLSEEALDDDQPREILLGAMVARALGVDVGDELVVLLQAVDGSLGNELLEVTGILETGNVVLDRHTVLMHLDDLRFIAAMDDEVHEILLAASLDDAPRIAAGLRQEFAGQDLVVRPWQEIATELYMMIELAESVTWVLLLIIFLIAALGTFNTLRMSTLERRKEFGVMMAVGMTRRRVVGLVVGEGLIIGLMGAALGGLIGAAFAYGTGHYGLSLAALTGGDTLTLMGVAFTDRIHFDVRRDALVIPVVGIVVVTTLCALWPAFRAAGEEPRDAIAGR